jgi:esterase/lipase
MRRIQANLTINIDHLFCAAFRHLGRGRIAVDDLHRAVYLAARQIARSGEYRRHATIGDNLVELLAPVPHRPAESILELAEARGIVTRAGGEYRINKLQFEMMHMFHTIRLKNPLVVIANELEPLKSATRILADIVNARPKRLREETAAELAQEDLHRYAERYRKTFREGVSLDRGSGAPFFRPVKGSDTGIVLSHGFLSRPEEIRPLAEALVGMGHSVYAVRLEGHGTTPDDLARTRWRDWYRAYLRGYEALRCTGGRVFLAGFSTGGVVALLAAGLWRRVDGAIAISAPYDLGDIRARLLPAVNFWNELLEKLRVERGRYEFVENHPENPDINYRRIPVRALRQLDRLMGRCREALPRIEAPVLLMHGDHDPGVNVKSADKYLHRIGSAEKSLELIGSERHVVVRGPHLPGIAEKIDSFIRKAAGSGTDRAD